MSFCCRPPSTTNAASCSGSTAFCSRGQRALGCQAQRVAALSRVRHCAGAQRPLQSTACAAAGGAPRQAAALSVPPQRVEEEASFGRPSAAVLTPSIDSITAPVRDDLAACNANMMSIVGERHPMLKAAAERIFGAGGKKLRPVLCFLVARATAQACGLR